MLQPPEPGRKAVAPAVRAHRIRPPASPAVARGPAAIEEGLEEIAEEITQAAQGCRACGACRGSCGKGGGG